MPEKIKSRKKNLKQLTWRSRLDLAVESNLKKKHPEGAAKSLVISHYKIAKICLRNIFVEKVRVVSSWELH